MNSPQATKDITDTELSIEDRIDLLASLLIEIICEELCTTS